MSLGLSHVPYKKLISSIWARSRFHRKKLAKSYKIVNEFEISKKSKKKNCEAQLIVK